MPQQFTSPVGRIVTGDPWVPNEKDQTGAPRVVKSGPKAGQPSPQWFIGLAIAKNDPEWPTFYNQIVTEARTSWPQLFDAAGNCIKPDFAWKIEDGDDATPKYNAQTQQTRRNIDREGYPGHWVVKFTSGYAPKVYVETGPNVFTELTDKTRLVRGDYVRVAGTMDSNGSPQTPGLFVNLGMVLHVGKGVPITSGPDAATAFSGLSGGLPAGAQPLPAAGHMQPGAPMPGAAPVGAPPIPPAQPGHAIVPPGGPGTATPAAPLTPAYTSASAGAAPAPSSPPQPYGGYMQPGGGPPPAPAAPAPTPPPVPVRVMLPAANGIPYESYIAQGWTDDMLRQNGMMQ